MPIQFRCQYCRQLLGISKSRAGSAVDCPACGRTLRVPSAEGTVETADASSMPMSDVSLRSALEELSSLTSISAATSRRESALSANEMEVHRDSMRIVPLSAAAQSSSEQKLSAKSQSEPVVQPLIVLRTQDPAVPDLKGQQKHEDRRPVDLESALQVLIDPQETRDSLSRNPAAATATDRPRRTVWLMSSFMAVLVSFGIGFLAGRTFVGRPAEQGRVAADAASGTVDHKVVAAAVPKDAVSGHVMYADEAGAMKPDSEALLLLVPAENNADLKLDARPMRDLHASDARRAVEAAIHVLKGSVTRAAADGTFQLERRYSGPGKLVIISRHASRPVSEAVEEVAANTLAAWFDSPSQLTGRLQVQVKSVPAAEPGNGSRVEVTFARP